MQYFKLQKEGGVAVLTFDRNEKRNPLNEDSVSELEANLINVRDVPARVPDLGEDTAEVLGQLGISAQGRTALYGSGLSAAIRRCGPTRNL